MRHKVTGKSAVARVVALAVLFGFLCTNAISAHADDGNTGAGSNAQSYQNGSVTTDPSAQGGDGTGNEGLQEQGEGEQVHGTGEYGFNGTMHWNTCRVTGCKERHNEASHSFGGWTDIEGEDAQMRECVCGHIETRLKSSGGGQTQPGGGQPSTGGEGQRPPAGEYQTVPGGAEQTLPEDEDQSEPGEKQERPSLYDNTSSPGGEQQIPTSAVAEDQTVAEDQAVPGGEQQVRADAHTHTFGDWQFDGSFHRRSCTVEGCTETEVGTHDFGFGAGTPIVSNYDPGDGVLVDIYSSTCDFCGAKFERMIPVGNRRNEGQAEDNTVRQETASVDDADDGAGFEKTVIDKIKTVVSAGIWDKDLPAIDLGINTAFSADMLDAMRDSFGKAAVEFRFVFKYEGKQYMAVIPKGADLRWLPGGLIYSAFGLSEFGITEGIMYVAQQAGGTVTEITDTQDAAAKLKTGGENIGLSTGSVTGSLTAGKISLFSRDLNDTVGFGYRNTTYVEVNNAEGQGELIASVSKAGSGDVTAVNLGTTSALSAGFFEALADAEGKTRTTMVFQYALKGVSGGAVRQTVIPAGTDISGLVEAGRSEGILYLEKVTGCPGEIVAPKVTATENHFWKDTVESGPYMLKLKLEPENYWRF